MKLLKIFILLVILVSFGFFIRATDMAKVMSSMQQVGFRFVWLIVVTFLGYLFGTIGWKYCMGPQGAHLRLKDLFFIRHIGETVSIINPTSVVGGEAMKVFLLQDQGVERKVLITSVLISRVIMALTQVVLFLLAGAFLLLQDERFSSQISWTTIGLYLLLASVSILVLVLKPKRLLRNAALRTRFGVYLQRRTETIRMRLWQVLDDLSFYFKNSKKALALSFLFFVLHWFFGAMEFYLILIFLGIDVNIIQAILVDMGVVFFKAAGAFVPGQIGFEEYGNKVMLAAIGVVGTEIWITASILRRTRQLFWIFFGLLVYLFMFKKWGVTPRVS
ncbi:MAG: flippase-like domain-containing protein [Saprospiraceae bacterium]|nr:flippase-like domain-containing protein [Saprospiraceae bacterium]